HHPNLPSFPTRRASDLQSPLKKVVVDEPKAAGQERALAGGQSVDSARRLVAEEDAPDHQPPFDLADGIFHPRIFGGDETNDRKEDRKSTRLNSSHGSIS